MSAEKITTTRIEEAWLGRLAKKGYTADTVFDRGQYEDLKRQLLRRGGEAVILPRVEPDYEKLMQRGEFQPASNAVSIKGRVIECHNNTAKLWARTHGDVKICTGYALSEDGAWRQHSWGHSSSEQRVVETTEGRVLYFGFLLTDEEAERFHLENT
jgi:hypothetical protein